MPPGPCRPWDLVGHGFAVANHTLMWIVLFAGQGVGPGDAARKEVAPQGQGGENQASACTLLRVQCTLAGGTRDA